MLNLRNVHLQQEQQRTKCFLPEYSVHMQNNFNWTTIPSMTAFARLSGP
jgi:hypothetical protein